MKIISSLEKIALASFLSLSPIPVNQDSLIKNSSKVDAVEIYNSGVRNYLESCEGGIDLAIKKTSLEILRNYFDSSTISLFERHYDSAFKRIEVFEDINDSLILPYKDSISNFISSKSEKGLTFFNYLRNSVVGADSKEYKILLKLNFDLQVNYGDTSLVSHFNGLPLELKK